MMSRRRSQYHQYHSPRSSICAKRLNFEDSSNRNKNDDDDNAEIVTEEDEYDFMSNEEKIAQVFTLVRSPFEMRRKSLLSISSPGKSLNATPYDNEKLPPRQQQQQQQQAQSQGICKKRTMEDRSPVKGASATRSMLQTKKAPVKQYAYCLRVFIGGAQDLINTNVGGTGADRTGSVTVTDLRTMKLASVTRAGRTPEHVLLSPDGRHVAVVLANGAATSKTDPAWNKVIGLFKVYALENGRLREVARADTSHWAQGAAWNASGTLLLQQCAAERELIGFRFDGKTLVRDKAITLPFAARPGAVAAAHSR